MTSRIRTPHVRRMLGASLLAAMTLGFGGRALADSIALNGQGNIARLGATFEQHREGAAPALHGILHHRD